ncbi:unnamed protein product [Ilex paraguariensis]|uniref:Hexosyltransferase n=1 Tax=Ilex paraguariensis TaxID=185542 RepID=A0ABC8SQB4_9AQUA
MALYKIVNRMWMVPDSKGITRTTAGEAEMLKLVSEGCDSIILRREDVKHEAKEVFGEGSSAHHAVQTLDKTISNIKLKLEAARAAQESILSGSPTSEDIKKTDSPGKRKYLMVIGINTAFSSRKRRDSVRATWMPQGEKRRKLEEEKGIIVRFVIAVCIKKILHLPFYNIFATVGGILDRAIEAEDKKHGDILRLDHVEGYLELSAKTKTYFATAVALWDAEFYVKVDDDVHVNIATLGETLARHRRKPLVYIGCMKSGPVLAQKGVRYHEPEYWKFGEAGNKYFRHATGQLYAVSRDLATYISVNQLSFTLFEGMYCTSMLTKMYLWDLGLLDSMCSILTIGDYVVEPHQIASGGHRRATFVLLRLTGAAVEFAGRLIGLRRSIDGAVKERMLCGLLPFENQLAILPNSGR